MTPECARQVNSRSGRGNVDASAARWPATRKMMCARIFFDCCRWSMSAGLIKHRWRDIIVAMIAAFSKKWSWTTFRSEVWASLRYCTQYTKNVAIWVSRVMMRHVLFALQSLQNISRGDIALIWVWGIDPTLSHLLPRDCEKDPQKLPATTSWPFSRLYLNRAMTTATQAITRQS